MAKYNQNHELLGNVFNIQRYTIHDGPGIRTEIFFKGCPMECKWCSNPESIKPYSEIGVYTEHCIGIDKCGHCLKLCPVEGASPLLVEDNKVAAIDRERCINCVACGRACPNDTLKIFGQWMTVEEVMKPVLSDRDFYVRTGGGVTVSGGDALMQWEFCRELLSRCQFMGIQTLVETELQTIWSVVEEILPFADLWIVDIKVMDSREHRKYTGSGNERILENLKKLVETGARVILRTPVIKGINDTDENLKSMGEYIRDQLGNRVLQHQLLPYRLLGEDKYAALGKTFYRMTEEPPQREEYEPRIRAIAERLQRDYGIPAVAGATTKINL